MATQAQINNRNRSRGKNFERRMADKMGDWYRIPYSGSSELFGLGDVRDTEDKNSASFMMECKTITPRSAREINYSIKEEWLVGRLSIVSKAKYENDKFWSLAFTKKGSPNAYIITSLEQYRAFTRLIEMAKDKGFLSNQNGNATKTLEEIDTLYEKWINER